MSLVHENVWIKDINIFGLFYYLDFVLAAMNNILLWEKMSYFVRCKFILNGFNVKYTPEWQSIYTTIGNYIFKVYKEYHKKCKNDIYWLTIPHFNNWLY